MIKQYGITGIIELRKYEFGGVYLIVGNKWFTLKEGNCEY